MTLFAVAGAVICAALLCLITVVQILYMESLRLRARDLPALQFFKDTLEARIGVETETGVLAFSIVKHTLMLLLGVYFLGTRFADRGGAWQSLFEAAVFAWLTMVVCTYVFAQVLYRKTSGHWLLPLAPLLRLCARLVRPLTAILGFFQSLVELHGEPMRENPSQTGDIEALISAGEEEGIIQEADRELIQSVVAFGDKTVREVMTPRPKIVAIEAGRTLEDLRELVIHEQYSRIPVYEQTIDQIIGFVHVRDMFELDEADRAGRLVRELIRPIRFVPETKTRQRSAARDAAGRRAHGHRDRRVRQHGAGLATMEDLVEEILGEIHDEHEPERDVHKESDSSFVVAGSLDLDRLHELLGFRPPDETESTTIGGLVTEWLGHVPRVG